MLTERKLRRTYKKMALFTFLGLFIVLLGCSDKNNKDLKKGDPIATMATEPLPHDHDHEHYAITKSDPGERIMTPDAGEHLWIFPESKDKLGSGGKLQIYMDSESHPHASAGFAKYEMGVGGALPEHKHNKTEEIAYFLSGEGIVITYVNGKRQETPVKEGYVWYTPPGEWHSFRNMGNEPLKLVFTNIPNAKNGLLSFFKKVGAEPGKETPVFSPEEFAKIATEHDLILKPAKID